jgi:putative membrane protein
VAALGLVLAGLGTAGAGYLRWRGNEEAIGAGRPLPVSRLVPAVAAGVAAVIVVVAVLVGIEVLGR